MNESLEVRIRQAMKLPDRVAEEGCGYVDLLAALEALGIIMAECLAHLPEETATAYFGHILRCRKQWQAHPRVLEQLKAEGRA